LNGKSSLDHLNLLLAIPGKCSADTLSRNPTVPVTRVGKHLLRVYN
jgi:hypothetical protein